MIAIVLSFLLLLVPLHAAVAQESLPGTNDEDNVEEVQSEEAYTFPKIEPALSLYGGYRFVGHSGASEPVGSLEYEYLHSSVTLGGELRVFSFPHRVYLDIDYINSKDYFGDVSYAYKDLLLFRGINRTVWHNIENISLVDLDPSTASPGVDVRDRGAVYGTDTGITNLFLRLKTPDFPLHLYLDTQVTKGTGSVQQRNLLGSGYFDDPILRTSQSRDIDWETKTGTIGSNVHLGPVELDISHGEQRFDAGGDKVLYDQYGPAGSLMQPGGTFPHNLIPDLKGSSNTLKIHTSYTGGLVASATFANIKRENEDSSAKASYFIGEGEVTWIPDPTLGVFVRYRHRELDAENPDAITVADAANPLNSVTYSIKPPISSIADIVSGTIRYKPLPKVTLRAEYTYEHVRRENADQWDLPDSTTENAFSLSADVRLIKGLTLKARYTHKNIDSPAYNTDPDRSDGGTISLTWVPVPKIVAVASYGIAKEKRDDLRFADFTGASLDGSYTRSVLKEGFLGSLTFLASETLSVTGSFSYLYNRVQQDLAYLNEGFTYQTAPSVPYKDIAHNYTIDVQYLPRNNVTLTAGAAYTVSSGAFYPTGQDLLEPISVAALSSVKLKETVWYLSGEYRLKSGLSLMARYKYTNLDNVLGGLNEDTNNGRAHILSLLLSKRW